MDRRDFMKVAGGGLVALAAPGSLWASLSGLSESEVERKVKNLVSRMTLGEKLDQMHGVVSPVDWVKQTGSFVTKKRYTWDTKENTRLGIPALRCTDGPRGCGLGNSTCFPVGMARGATWDPDLEERIGAAMGYETRAQGGNVHLAPCINLLRHPSWGRAQETFGEDPCHLGMMGAAQTRGLQKHVMACPKHFAANSIEGNRFKVNVKMDERTLREVYLPHFKRCVEAGAASIMTAYNDLNGYLCAHNRHLLRDILKGEWGFKGFAMSDWSKAVEDAVAAANAGLDLEMPTGAHFGRKLKRAVERGEVKMEVIDEAVSRILRMKLLFIGPDFYEGYDKAKVAGPEHTALALEAAQKGIVLLKNEKNALPLDLKEVKRIALLGELADYPNIGDRGSSSVNPPYAVSPLEGFKNRAGSSIKIIHEPGTSLAAAKKAAREADAVVVIAGCTFKDEGEGGFGWGDRLDLGLHEQEEKLIRAAAEETDRLIVVLEAGAAITVEPWEKLAQAILMAWYPGMEGGNAIADIILGNVNPSGKLPITFHKSQDQLPYFNNRADEIEYDLWHGYRLFEKKGYEPSYPFGHGLSYTRYEYRNLRLNRERAGRQSLVKAMVEVANIGGRSGEEVVQLYVSYPRAAVERPVKELKAFKRVALKPGEKKTVTLEFAVEDLAYWDMNENKWVVEKGEHKILVGPSSRKEDLLSTSLKITA